MCQKVKRPVFQNGGSRFVKVDESNGWLVFLYYKSLLLSEGFEMCRIEWDIQKGKVHRNQRDGGSNNFL